MRGRTDAPPPDESHYRSIFEHAAVSLWEMDIAKLRRRIREIRRRDGADLQAHMVEFPGFIEETAEATAVTEVNPAGLGLFEAESRSQLLGPLSRSLGAAARDILAGAMLAIDEGRSGFEVESAATTLKGRKLSLIALGCIPPASGAYDRMLLTLVDATSRCRSSSPPT
jgi:hypothetical protein